MAQERMTVAQKRAVQMLIRAKSDVEIARLLRKSYSLLKLNRRRRSNISHRELWQDYELRLLGRIRDEELAKLLRRSVAAVAAKRESFDIPIFASHVGECAQKEGAAWDCAFYCGSRKTVAGETVSAGTLAPHHHEPRAKSEGRNPKEIRSSKRGPGTSNIEHRMRFSPAPRAACALTPRPPHSKTLTRSRGRLAVHAPDARPLNLGRSTIQHRMRFPHEP